VGEAFEQAAVAMTAVVSDPERVAPRSSIEISCSAPNEELLLVDWLNAIVFEMSTRTMLFSRFEVRLDDHSLRGRAWGESVDVSRHDPIVEIKGATYTSLSVARDESGQWLAQCVVDV